MPDKTDYSYNKNDRLRQTITPQGKATQYDYDKNNRLIAHRSPDFVKKQGDFMKGELSMSDHRIVLVGAPTSAYDAVRLGSNLYVPVGNLGSGTPSVSTVLLGNYTWGALSGLTVGNADTLDTYHAVSFLLASALSDSVVSEETFGLADSAGAASTVSRGDHTHGTPSAIAGEFEGFLPNGYLKVLTADDSYNSGEASNVAVRQASATVKVAQKITVASIGRLSRAMVKLKAEAVPNGSIWLEIYSDNSGTPGSLLATSSKMPCAELATSYASCYFVFPQSSGNKLGVGNAFIVVAGDCTIDGINFVNIGYANAGSPTNLVYTLEGTVWTGIGSTGITFATYFGTDGANIPLEYESTVFPNGAGRLNISNLPDSIPDRKLAQITTASKVNGLALTGLANVPAGAGILPTANLPLTFTASLIGFTIDGGTVTPKMLTVDETVAMSAKAPKASPTFTGTVSGITATMVGLGNVANVLQYSASNRQSSIIVDEGGTGASTLTGYVKGAGTTALTGVAGAIFVPRACTADDFTVANFGTTDAWVANGIDLATGDIVPAGAVAVVIKCQITSTVAAGSFTIRTNATTFAYNAAQWRVPVANDSSDRMTVIINLDTVAADRLLDYYRPANTSVINMAIVGYFI